MSIAHRMRTELVTDALDMAITTYGGVVDGTIVRSDRDPSARLRCSLNSLLHMGSDEVRGASGQATTMS